MKPHGMMNAPLCVRGPVLKCMELMQNRFLRGWRVFGSPETVATWCAVDAFPNGERVSDSDALEAMKNLVSQGKLELFLRGICEKGHCVGNVPYADVSPTDRRCAECLRDGDSGEIFWEVSAEALDAMDPCPFPLPGKVEWGWRRNQKKGFGHVQAKFRKLDGISWECSVLGPHAPAWPIPEFDYATNLWWWQVRAGAVTVAMGNRLTRKGAKRAAEKAARAVWELHQQKKAKQG